MKKLKFLLRTASLCMAFILMGTNSVSAKTPKVKKSNSLMFLLKRPCTEEQRKSLQ